MHSVRSDSWGAATTPTGAGATPILIRGFAARNAEYSWKFPVLAELGTRGQRGAVTGWAWMVRRRVLVLWCFVLNPHLRSPYYRFLFCITR